MCSCERGVFADTGRDNLSPSMRMRTVCEGCLIFTWTTSIRQQMGDF